MPPIIPIELFAAIAVHVQSATTIKAAAPRAPQPWRNGTDPYVVVSQAGDAAPLLRGDGGSLADGILVQVSLFEAADDETPARLTALIGALDGTVVTGYGRGHVRGWRRVPDPDTDAPQHAIDVAYQAPR